MAERRKKVKEYESLNFFGVVSYYSRKAFQTAFVFFLVYLVWNFYLVPFKHFPQIALISHK